MTVSVRIHFCLCLKFSLRIMPATNKWKNCVQIDNDKANMEKY